MPERITVRALRAEEWAAARDLRLRALQDPVAGKAFFETLDAARARPDAAWQELVRSLSPDDPGSRDGRQLVGVASGGEFVATLTVRLQRAGEGEFGGGTITRDRGMLLGVWVAPEARGQGVLDELVDAAGAWTASRGVDRMTLWVHEENLRAQRVYARLGFTPTGQRVVEAIGPEIAMERVLGEAPAP